jgi:DeoR/GlpR family transcriptional regulator of sugar metabolism
MHSVIPAERYDRILKLVETQHTVSVSQLCEILNVSEMTVRRDLRLLSDKGLLKRVHGGAVAQQGRSYEPSYITRATQNMQQKEIIGRTAAELIEAGDSIALDVGTTTLELAKALVGTTDLTIITTSLHIANILSDAPNLRLILTGGIVRKGELSLVGHIAEQTCEGFRVDKAFIGIGGLHPDDGLTEYNLEDALVKRIMIKNAGQIIVVADSSKLGVTCFSWIAPLSAIDILVTDADAPEEILETLVDQGIEVIIAQ